MAARPAARSPDLSPEAYYVIVRGPLGAGKTTVARALAEAIRGRVVSIDEILETLEWDGGSERLFLRANDRAAAEARDAAAAGRPVVFDGNFYWRRVIDDLARRLGWPHVVVTLRVPRSICVVRDRDRPHSYGATAVRDVYARVARVRAGIPIDATGSVAQTVDRIRAWLPRRSDLGTEAGRIRRRADAGRRSSGRSPGPARAGGRNRASASGGGRTSNGGARPGPLRLAGRRARRRG